MNLFGHLLCPPSSPPLPLPTAQWAEATENNNSNSKSRTTTRRSRAATIIIIISLSSVKHDWRGAVPCWAALTVQYSQYSEHSLACVRPLQGVRLRVARVARKQNGVSNWGAVCGATQAQRMPCGRVCEWVRLSACVSVWVCVCVRLCHFNLKSFACIVHFLMCGKLFFSSCMRCSPSRRFNECPNWTCPPSPPLPAPPPACLSSSPLTPGAGVGAGSGSWLTCLSCLLSGLVSHWQIDMSCQETISGEAQTELSQTRAQRDRAHYATTKS